MVHELKGRDDLPPIELCRLPLRNRRFLRNYLRKMLREQGQEKPLRAILHDLRFDMSYAFAMPLEDVVSALEWPEPEPD